LFTRLGTVSFSSVTLLYLIIPMAIIKAVSILNLQV
jgi:hypothetical protein